jgi:hypothetical protein
MTRSPGIYERYLWVKRSAMSVNMNGWFGDGNGYTAARFAATSGFVTLEFANHAARLYGVDASWRAPLRGNAGLGRFALLDVFGYVRGENLDNGGNLYQIMPVNGLVGLEHRRGNWSSALDFQAVDAKGHVQAVRNELATPGYALLNLRTSYQWKLIEGAGVRLDAGIDNLANRSYVLPLGGLRGDSGFRPWLIRIAGKQALMRPRPGELAPGSPSRFRPPRRGRNPHR